jgi:hypothetical protein
MGGIPVTTGARSWRVRDLLQARQRLPTTRQILPQPGRFCRVRNVMNKN